MTWASFAARSGSLLLVTPLVLAKFSAPEISLWFFLLTLSGLQLMADFGFGPSFIRAVAYAQAGRRTLDSHENLLDAPNGPLLGSIFRTLQRAYMRIAMAGLIFGAIFGTWATLRPVAELANPKEGWIAWGIVLVCNVGMLRNSAYGIWMQGINEVARLRRIETILSFATTLGTAIVLFTFPKFIAAVCVAQGGALLSSFWIRALAGNFRPKSNSERATADVSVMRFVWPAAWRSGIGVLMSSAVFQVSGIIYAQYVSPEKAASYLLAMRIMQMIVQISMAPFYSKIPWFAALYGSDDRAALIPAVQKAMARCHWVFMAGVVSVNFVAAPLLHLVGSKTGFVPQSVWLLMGFAYLVERIGAMHMQFYSLTNHVLWHIANGITGSIYLLSALVLLPKVGVVAFPLAMLIGYLGFYTWFSIRLSSRHFGYNVWRFESLCSLPSILLTVGLILLTFYPLLSA